MADEVAAFLSVVRGTPDLWRSIDVRLIAVRVADAWICIGGQALLDQRSPEEVPRLRNLPRAESIFASQHVFPVEELESLLAQIRSGVLQLNQLAIRVIDGVELVEDPTTGKAGEFESGVQISENLGGRPLLSTHFSRAASGDASTPIGRRNYHSLRFSGRGVGDIIKFVPGNFSTIDRQLRVLRRPWNGLAHLSSAGLGGRIGLDSSAQVSFEFQAHFGLALDERATFAKDGSLHVEIVAATNQVRREASLGYAGVSPSGNSVNGSVQLGRRAWRRSAGVWRLVFERESLLPGAAVVLILRHANEPIQQVTVNGKVTFGNSLLVAHDVFDKDLTKFRSALLSTDHKGEKAFELAISRLLAFLGWVVDPFGENDDVPDHVAESGDTMYVVECTTGTLKGAGKLARLVRRTGQIRDALRARGFRVHEPHRQRPIASWNRPSVVPGHVQVQPVIICSIPHSQLAIGEVEDAGRDGVAVLAREDLAYLLEVAASGNRTEIDQIIFSRISR